MRITSWPHARKLNEQVAIVVVPRLCMRLMNDRDGYPLGESIWGDTRVELPKKAGGGVFQSLLDARQVTPSADGEIQFFPLATLFAMWPCALISSTARVASQAAP